MIKYLLHLLLLLCVFQVAKSQSTNKQSINSNWGFHKGNIVGFPGNNSTKTEWQPVTLPHSWNATDVTDDEPGYYRGPGWYKKTLYIPAADKNKQLYLYFEGANQEAKVYVNGHLAGKHIGGYTAFNIFIQPFLKFSADSLSQNEISVKVDNSFNENIPPLTADFTFFGGIYRDVYLLEANKIRFDLDNNASSGIKITTPLVNESTATIKITGKITNDLATGQKLKLRTVITDAAGAVVTVAENPITAASNSNEFSTELHVKTPHLWSPDAPYLYRIKTTITDQQGKIYDEVSNPLGLRWYTFDADKGFFLNGKSLKLIGASRHQDFKDMANALPNALHQRDMELLKNMGGNFVRIAHYPQDPAVLEACDRLGILVSEEIPVVNAITESDAFYNNCKEMQLEMIRQNRNHPSVIIWAYMNEVLLRPKYKKNSPEQNLYFARIAALAKSLDSLIKKEDTERYTMISCHGDFGLYQRVGITAIPQIVGWNLYQGWYSAGLEGFAKFLDNHHQTLPHTPMIITEFGADADTRIHSTKPERFDKSVEYQVKYHQFYLKTIEEKPFVAGAAIWNLADFNSETRADATPHINTKGISTIDREPKDAYFFYKANLIKRPFLKTGSVGWKLRSGIADDKGTCVQQVYIFSNAKEVELWQNGKKLGSKSTEMGVAIFDVPFTDGENIIKATATVNNQAIEDLTTIDFKLVPALFKWDAGKYVDLNISVGDNRFFVDDKLKQVWLPEQPYTKGSWGYIGGKVFTMPGQARQGFGSDKDIYGTDLDAVYQTQRIGIDAFRFDVPDGEYDLTLGFAELEGKPAGPALAYNLGGNEVDADVHQRSFDVLVNGNLLIKSLSTQNQLQAQREYTTTTRVSITGGQGITVKFNPFKGEAILNAIQLKQVY